MIIHHVINAADRRFCALERVFAARHAGRHKDAVNMPKTCEECKEEIEPENLGFEMNGLCICKSCFHPEPLDDYYDIFNLFDMR